MNKHLSNALTTAFPNLYSKAGPHVGDGWFLILWNLSVKLESFGARAAQIKEKFGGLRFYLEEGGDEAYEAIKEAETQASFTCENCGRPGTSVDPTGWIKTLCINCNRAL